MIYFRQSICISAIFVVFKQSVVFGALLFIFDAFFDDKGAALDDLLEFNVNESGELAIMVGD